MHHADIFYRSRDGLRLYARDYPGPNGADAVVCLPGLTRNSKDFAELAEHLRDRYRVICPDQRGRGRSAHDPNAENYRPDVYVGDMWELADLLGLPQFSVIGTSLGGLMAIGMAAQSARRIRCVVLNDIGPEIDARGLARIATYVGKSGPVATWTEAAQQTAEINAVAYPDFGADDWAVMARKLYVQEGSTPVLNYDPAISRGVANGSAAPALWPLFESLRGLPILALRGALSDLLSAPTFAEMARRIASVEPVLIANRGHAPNLAEPAALQAIDAFLAKHILGSERRVSA